MRFLCLFHTTEMSLSIRFHIVHISPASVQLISAQSEPESASVSGYHRDRGACLRRGWPRPLLRVTCKLKASLPHICVVSKQPGRGHSQGFQHKDKQWKENRWKARWAGLCTGTESLWSSTISPVKNWENNILPADYHHIILWGKGTQQCKMLAPLNAPVWRRLYEAFALGFYTTFK